MGEPLINGVELDGKFPEIEKSLVVSFYDGPNFRRIHNDGDVSGVCSFAIVKKQLNVQWVCFYKRRFGEIRQWWTLINDKLVQSTLTYHRLYFLYRSKRALEMLVRILKIS